MCYLPQLAWCNIYGNLIGCRPVDDRCGPITAMECDQGVDDQAVPAM